MARANRQISTHIAPIYGFRPLAPQTDALGARESVDQYQGLLIWRVDLAENKEGHAGWVGACNCATGADFVGFRR
jgi:hypothetical protein